jgi:hypothetical protein
VDSSVHSDHVGLSSQFDCLFGNYSYVKALFLLIDFEEIEVDVTATRHRPMRDGFLVAVNIILGSNLSMW